MIRRAFAPKRHCIPQRGVALLEVMIGVLLITFALLGLMALQARTVQLSAEAEDVQRASLLANEAAATMWAANTLNLPADQLEAWQLRVADATQAGLPGGVGEIEINGNTARVRITWSSPGAAGATGRYVTDVMMPVEPAAAP